jgi:ribose 5-phosphate isomerase B
MERKPNWPVKIALGSDHAGFHLKEDIKAYLTEMGVQVEDFGTNNPERTDYPLFAMKVARAVAAGEYPLGILICGSGVGMSITANKVRGIRAVVCSESYSAVLSRQHNNSNILCIGERVVGTGLARLIVEQWLDAEFEGGRHADRMKLITELEGRRGEEIS